MGVGQRLLDHLLDRLIRGRAWIAVVAFALIGIVAAQLWVVKLNVGIGRAIEHVATLQRENSALAIADSTFSSGERVERQASSQGMVPAPPGALHFDTVRGPLDVRLAAAALAKPVQAQAAPGTATGAETSASTTTAGATTSPEATAQAAPAETSPATAESAGAPAAAATATAPSTTAASTPEPSTTGAATEAASAPSTGGSSEATASAPEAGGGTQAAPGG